MDSAPVSDSADQARPVDVTIVHPATAPSTPHIVLHHLEKSRSRKLLWLLEELGLPYEVKFYRRVSGLAPPELKQVHPLGKSPVISDGELVLAESGAITEYLCETYDTAGALHPLPPDRRGCLDHRYWLHYSEGSLAPFFVMLIVFDRVVAHAPWIVRPVARGIADAVKSAYLTPNIQSSAAYVEARVAENGGFLVGGRFTAADVQMSGVVGQILALPGYAEKHPGLAAYAARLKARPAYARAAQRNAEFEGADAAGGPQF